MPRDGAGNYTLPPGNPVFPGTVIEADWANPTMSDIATALTDSLSRTGSGGMLVPFLNADGAVGAPGMSWINEPSSGWYRAALNDFWYSVGNENIFRITKTGIELAAGKTAINISSFTAVQDADPAPNMKQGQQWYESDTGGFYMRYVNPDLTETYIALAAAGGDFIPFAMRGAANGVASLDATTKVPMSELSTGAGGVATLDGTGKVPLAQLPTIPPVTGQAVQVVAATDVGSSHSSLVLTNFNAALFTMTPKSATSRLLIEVQYHGVINAVGGTNTAAFYQLFDFTGAVNIGVEYPFLISTGGGGNQLQGPLVVRAIVNNAVLTPRQFSLRGRTSNAAAAVSALNMVWSVTEIQN